MPMERFLTISQVEACVTLSKTEIYRRIKAKQFPEQVRLSENRVAWAESEIVDWIERKKAKRFLRLVNKTRENDYLAE